MAKLKWLDEYCNKCGDRINSWDARLSKALAYRYSCCEPCIATEYDMTAGELRDRMEPGNGRGLFGCLPLYPEIPWPYAAVRFQAGL